MYIQHVAPRVTEMTQHIFYTICFTSCTVYFIQKLMTNMGHVEVIGSTERFINSDARMMHIISLDCVRVVLMYYAQKNETLYSETP